VNQAAAGYFGERVRPCTACANPLIATAPTQAGLDKSGKNQRCFHLPCGQSARAATADRGARLDIAKVAAGGVPDDVVARGQSDHYFCSSSGKLDCLPA
jgi:hypothetical protein